MSTQQVRSLDRKGASRREWVGVLVLAGLIIAGIGFYLALRASDSGRAADTDLLPYQTLARTLPESDQHTFRALRQGLLQAETDRARLGEWPTPSVLAGRGVAPFADSEGIGYRWQRFQEGKTVNYLGLPLEPSAPAWLLAIKEPEPNTPPDPAPLDDEHHRLPDGTTLHIYVWTHSYGGRIEAGFVPEPHLTGWTQVFAAPPNPLYLPKP